jgi:hypothetical protein
LTVGGGKGPHRSECWKGTVIQVSLGVPRAEWCEGPGSKSGLLLQDLHETILCCTSQYASGVSEGWEVGLGHGLITRNQEWCQQGCMLG